jgi:Flp pilus assembly protein TadG
MRSVKRSAPYRAQDGAVAVMVALMLVVLMAAVALAVDVGGLYLRRRELVNGSDAAALSAARTCARGPGNDPAFARPEDAADHQMEGNGGGITSAEILGPTPNITAMVGCGVQYGHVSVRYTSQQELHFAPVLGFSNSSPVTTAATASWGLGSNNPVPMVLSDLFKPGTCPMPPQGTPVVPSTCAFWYDNDSLGAGNFTFLSLNPAGWDVEPYGNCPGAQSGGTSLLTKWINGEVPASVVINWTKPTYVCSDAGIRGVGSDSNGQPNSQLWNAVSDLQGQTRDFPINWEGWGEPIPGASPAQGTIFKTNGDLDKYDIIGFAAMRIDQVVLPQDASSDETCTLTFTFSTQRQDLSSCIPPGGEYNGVKFVPGRYKCNPLVGTTCTIDPALNQGDTATATVSYTTYTDCGPPPTNSSAVCVILTWQGSTLTDDYPGPTDNITVVHLCDLAYQTCLDQRHAAPYVPVPPP